MADEFRLRLQEIVEAETTEKPTLRRRLAERMAAGEGLTVERPERVEVLEAAFSDRAMIRRELDLIAFQALDYAGGSEQDLQAVARRRLIQQGRVAWQQDPQIGAAVELLNNFTLGRGVPKPKASDPAVQKELDDAWEDEDNQLVLTSYAAQLAMNTDLSLQSNLFFLIFREGDDGRVKLAMLDHDTVENIVRDPDNRRKVLWYVARKRRIAWDYRSDQPSVLVEPAQQSGQYMGKVTYYQHWRNEPGEKQKPEASKIGKGRVYHVAVNKTGEMAFGYPTMHRILRWATAFNNFMEARVDMARAAAAFVMKRKAKGTPTQVQKAATQALSRSGEMARYLDPDSDPNTALGPRSGSIITENESMEHQAFKLDSGAGGAQTDSQMIRSQISAATGFPQHYLGDASTANLATATSLELPVLKTVESRQEIVEQIFRWFFDEVIDAAVASGRLTAELSPEELAALEKAKGDEGDKGEAQDAADAQEPAAVATNGATPQEASSAETNGAGGPTDIDTVRELQDSEQEGLPEDDPRRRSFDYEFGLPSPLRRMLLDLVNAVATAAKTFDPNGTNLDLTRTLAAVVFGEGLEMEDPAAIIKEIWPPGYKDPAVAAFEAQRAGAPPPPGQPGAPGQPGQPGEQGPQGEDNPYGAPMNGSQPEDNPYGFSEARRLEEALAKLSPASRKLLADHIERTNDDFDEATAAIRDLARPKSRAEAIAEAEAMRDG